MQHASRVLAVAVVALLVAVPAGAALRAIEQAYELTLDEVTLPGNDVGYLMVRRCPRCRPEVLRVDARTRYRVRPSSEDVTLRELKAQAANARRTRAAPGYLYVYYDAKTRFVRRLVLDAAS